MFTFFIGINLPQDFPEGDHGGKTKLDTMARYKFYLAFENNNNVDYVTEKYFQALMMGTVPGKRNSFVNERLTFLDRAFGIY
jgi:hypothetical protein